MRLKDLLVALSRSIAVGTVLTLAGYFLLYFSLHLWAVAWSNVVGLDPNSSPISWLVGVFFSAREQLAQRGSPGGAIHGLVLAAALATITLGYGILLNAIRALDPSDPRRQRWVALILVSLFVAVSAVLVFSPGLFSRDIYNNIMFGRIAALHGGNPFIDPPSAFPRDPFMRVADWPNTRCVYGPMWVLMSEALTHLLRYFHATPFHYVLTYKLFSTLFHAASAALVYAILRHLRPRNALHGATLFLLNPLLMVESVGGGHNDAAMYFFLLLGIYAHVRGHPLAMVASTAVATMAKLFALPLLLLFIVGYCRSAPQRRQCLSRLAATAGICIAVFVLTYLPYWEGLPTLGAMASGPSGKRTINSLAGLLVYLSGGQPAVQNALSWGVSGILIISAAILAVLTRKPADAIKHAALFHLIFCTTTLWFLPWHVCVLVALVVVGKSEALSRAGMLLSHSVLLFYVLPLLSVVAERYAPIFILIPPLWIGLHPGAKRMLQRIGGRGAVDTRSSGGA